MPEPTDRWAITTNTSAQSRRVWHVVGVGPLRWAENIVVMACGNCRNESRIRYGTPGPGERLCVGCVQNEHGRAAASRLDR